MKKLWRKNFEIKRSSFLLAYEALESFSNFQEPTIGETVIKESIWINKGIDNIGTYFLVAELRKIIDLTMSRIINDTERVARVHKKTIQYSKKYFQLMQKVEKMQLTKLSNKQLNDLYEKIYQVMQSCHGYSLCSTWFVDSDGEDLTNYLLNYVKNKIDQHKVKIDFAQAFSTLTTPAKYSMAQIEAKQYLRILQLIKADKKSLAVFSNKKALDIENNLGKISPKLRRKIINHYKKWRWAPYTYIGPAYELDYYLELWSGILRQRININEELKKLELVNDKTKNDREKIFKDLKVDLKHRKIFNLAAEIVWLKAYRKDALFYGCFVLERVYREIGNRLGFSLKQATYLSHFEIAEALLKNKFSVHVLNERIKFFVNYCSRGRVVILTEKKAKDFLNKQIFEKIKIKDLDELKGTPASPGKVRGTVKVINVPEEMGKMCQGDIMVSHTTFPALVPAMKKAAAIVTDDGGLTCHAAIVARELKTPCVVGVKTATKVLKDGDKVEVDANKGIIKKL